MELSEQTKLLCDCVLQCPDAYDAVSYIVQKYAAKSNGNTLNMFTLLELILRNSMQHGAERELMKSFALDMSLLGETSDERTEFARLVPIMMAVFPDYGVNGVSSKPRIELFDKFRALMHNAKAFNWKRDHDWARLMKYEEYLRGFENAWENE